MSIQEDCPICSKIMRKAIKDQNSDFCLLQLGSCSVVARLDHEASVPSHLKLKALELLNLENQKGFCLSEYDAVPGHWAIIMRPVDIPEGKTVFRNE